jgi:KDO2-lipid IV(A) lauroyltransferase
MLAYGFASLLLVDVPNWTPENINKSVEFQGLEHIDAALQRGKGVIVASTHAGFLPAMYIAMALKGYKVNIIANVNVSGPLVAIRPVNNLRCIPTGSMDGPHSIRPLLHKVLKENQLLYIYADFSQRKQMGIRFLGRLGHTPAGIPVLAQETDAAIIPAFTYPTSINHMIVKFLPEFHLIVRPEMTRKEFLGENMLELNNLMTWLIRKAPLLYFEHTSYDLLKMYRREVDVQEGDSREVGLKLLELAEQAINSTFERGRKDKIYLDNINNLREMVNSIPENEISTNRFTVHFEVGWRHVRDSFIDMCQIALKLGLDKPVNKCIRKALQDLIITPL